MPKLDKDGNQIPEGKLPDNNNQPAEKLFSVNGKEVSWATLLESYNNLQKDYTQKSQELSEKNKSAWDEEQDKTKEILKNMGFATTEELDEFRDFKKSIESDKDVASKNKEFDDFISDFKTLTEPQKVILKDLKKLHTDKDYSEILKTTWFIDQAQIEKSKLSAAPLGWANIWLPAKQEEEKNIMDRPNVKKFWMLSKEEYNKKMESVWM